MSFALRISTKAQDDLERLFGFLAVRDRRAALRARAAITRAYQSLRDMPFACRKADADTPFLRELIIPFGHTGYVALFEIDDAETVTVLAVRHQREEDYH